MASETAREASGEHATAQPARRPDTPSQASAPATLGTAGTYEVRPGDSLWSIARKRLGKKASEADIARFVDRLWGLNADVIHSGSPDMIVPGEKLRLPRTP